MTSPSGVRAPTCLQRGLGRSWALHVAAALALGLAGCGSKPARISGVIEAAAGINPSVSQRASPLLLRVYELKSATAFNAAAFVSLYQRDQAELGADLLGREEFMLAPGESRSYAKTLAADTRFLGVVAAYRDVERARWRAVVPVAPGEKQEIVIRADALAVQATMKR
jgi:type VI secretion system protein VasD